MSHAIDRPTSASAQARGGGGSTDGPRRHRHERAPPASTSWCSFCEAWASIRRGAGSRAHAPCSPTPPLWGVSARELRRVSRARCGRQAASRAAARRQRRFGHLARVLRLGLREAFGEAAVPTRARGRPGSACVTRRRPARLRNRRRGPTTCCSSRFVASTRSCARNGGRRRQRERAGALARRSWARRRASGSRRPSNTFSTTREHSSRARTRTCEARRRVDSRLRRPCALLTWTRLSAPPSAGCYALRRAPPSSSSRTRARATWPRAAPVRQPPSPPLGRCSAPCAVKRCPARRDGRKQAPKRFHARRARDATRAARA